MILSAIVLLHLTQGPKTFEEVEIEKIKAYVGLKTFREEMHVSMQPGDPRGDFVRLIEIDGPLSRATLLMPDLNRFQAICDGKIRRSIHHASKMYSEGPASDGKPFKASDHLAQAKDANTFALVFDSLERPVRFAANPNFVLEGISEETVAGEKLRRVVAVSTRSDSSVRLTLTQWFLADKWVLKRFSLAQDESTVADGRCLKLSFDATFEPNSFALDPEAIKGYKKIDDSDK